MSRVLLTLSGPSCVGKGPLQEAVGLHDSSLISSRPVLYHSRRPRLGEVHGHHYYFLPPALIRSLSGNQGLVVSQVRSDWQALDMLQVADLLEDHDLVFAEVYYTFLPYLKVAAAEHGFEVRTVFLHPLIPNVNPDAIVSTMEGKLQRRKTDSLEKIHERARSAPTEMQCAVEHATHQIINLAGEDDVEEWGALGTRDGQKGSRPIGSLTDLGDAAQWLVKEFVRVARGELPSGTYTRT